jgi:hypothetical protein
VAATLERADRGHTARARASAAAPIVLSLPAPIWLLEQALPELWRRRVDASIRRCGNVATRLRG